MEQNNIDKLFKNKLGQREVPFRESYWMGAEKMIAEQERKRSWRRYLWLLLLLPLLIGVYCWWLQPASNIGGAEQGSSITPTAVESKGQLESSSMSATTIDTNGTHAEKPSTEEAATTQEVADARKASPDGPPLPGDASDKSELSPKTGPNEGSPAFSIPPIPASQNQLPNNPSGREAGVGQRPQANNNAPVTPVLSDESMAVLTTDEKTDLPGSDIADSYTKNQVDLLALPALALQLEGSVPPSSSVMQHHVSKKIRIGLLGGSQFMAQPGSEGLGFSGAHLGLSANYLFKPRLSVNTDLLYDWRKDNITFPNGNDTLKTSYAHYSFGLGERSTEVILRHSHLLTLPVYLGFHLGRHQLEVGAQLSVVLGHRGKVMEERFSPPEYALDRSEQKAWVAVDGADPFEFGVLGGYRYQFTNQWSAGVRFLIQPGQLSLGNQDEAVLASADANGPYNPTEMMGNAALENNDYSRRMALPVNPAAAKLRFQVNLRYLFNRKSTLVYKPFTHL